MAINITFGGANIRRPGAYAVVNTANMVPTSAGASRALAIVGGLDEGATLAPGIVYEFDASEPSEARKALVQGDVLEAMNTAWRHGANRIYVAGVNKATAATITLKDSTTVTAIDVLKLTANIFGTGGNATKAEVTATNLVVSRGTVQETYVLGSKTFAALAAEVNASSKLVSAEALAVGVLPLAVKAVTNFTGGAAGAAIVDSDWDDAIDLLETEFVDGIVPITTATAIQAKVDTHVQAMSSVLNRKRRRAFYGHATGADVATVSAMATALANERALVVSPSPLVADSAGNKTAVPSYLAAAAIAGMWAGQDPQEPITYKNVKFVGLEVKYKATEIVELLSAHVCPIEVSKNAGYRITQGVTTSPSEDLTMSELSVSTLKDVMSEDLETYFENKYVGQAGVRGIEVTIYNDFVSRLELYITNGWISGYVSDSVQVRKNGTTFTLEWEGTPTLPINNFLITTNLSL